MTRPFTNKISIFKYDYKYIVTVFIKLHIKKLKINL